MLRILETGPGKKEGELQLLNNYGVHRLELGPQGHYAISLLR